MRDISEILRKEIRGLEGVVSIVDVEVSHDNSFAKVIFRMIPSTKLYIRVSNYPLNVNVIIVSPPIF